MSSVNKETYEVFQAIRFAVWDGRLCLANLKNKKTGKLSTLLCISDRSNVDMSDTDSINLTPVGLLPDSTALAEAFELPNSLIKNQLVNFTDADIPPQLPPNK